MKKILTVNKTILSTYPHTANVATFLWNDSQIFPWLMNYFIKPFGWDLCGLDYEDFWFLDCPAIEIERMDRQIIKKRWGNYLSFIKDNIDEGYYVYLCVDTNCISAYKQLKGPHDLMIYGYDDEKQIVYIADFFDQRYSFSTAFYIEIMNATEFSRSDYTHFWVFHNDIIMMKTCYNENKTFFPHRVKVSLLDFVNAEPSKFIYTRIRENTPEDMANYLYGMDCYQILYNHLEHSMATHELLPYWKHSFHLMVEHKAIMCERIKYMGLNGYLVNWNKYLIEYKKLYEEQKICENLYIKYVLDGKQQVLKKIYDKIREIEKKENGLLLIFINDIVE